MISQKIITALTLFCIPSLSLMAQEKDSMKVNLHEVIISATRTAKNLDETGRSVSVITKEQIQQSACQSVAGFLSQQEGIYITGNGQTPGANQSIFMRGANSNQTAVLIDGVRINDASTVNNTLDLSELSLLDIEQIEIIRGSQSTLYGSSAIGGVINIITNRSLKKGTTASASLQGGTFGASTFTGEAAGTLAYKLNNGIFFKGVYDQLHVDGLDATLDTVTDPAVFKHRDNDDWDKLTAGAEGGFQNNKWDARAAYRYLKMNTDLDLAAYTDDDNYTLDFTRHILREDIAYQRDSRWRFSLNSAYSSTERIALNDSSVIDAAGTYDHTYSTYNYSGKNISVDLQANYKIKFLECIAGYSMNREEMNQSGYYYSPFFESRSDLDTLHPEATLNSFFFQGDLNGASFSPKLSAFQLVAGMRYYKHTFFDGRYTFEINPSLKIGEGSLLYLSYSTGFNAPSLYQLYAPEEYFTWDAGYSTGLTRGTKTLQPETSRAFEIGIRQKVNDLFQFNVSIFRTITDHLIEYAYLWDGNIAIDSLGSDFNRDDFRGDKYLNVGKQTSQGIELSLESRLSQKCMLTANVSLVSGKILFSQSGFDSTETVGNHVQLYSNGIFLTKDVEVTGLIRRPPTANLLFTYSPVNKLSLGFSLQYVSARSDIYYDSKLGPYGALNNGSINEYALAGFSAGYVQNNFRINFRMENLFNEQYQEIYGFTTRGRGGYLAISYSW